MLCQHMDLSLCHQERQLQLIRELLVSENNGNSLLLNEEQRSALAFLSAHSQAAQAAKSNMNTSRRSHHHQEFYLFTFRFAKYSIKFYHVMFFNYRKYIHVNRLSRLTTIDESASLLSDSISFDLTDESLVG